VCEIVALRSKYPTWGGKKLRELLADKVEVVPCVRTIDRVLQRAGMVRQKRRNRGRWLDNDRISKALRCNHIWSVDFKGWWQTKDRKPCFPLTVRDGYSRYMLGIYALPGTGYEGVKAAFEELFSTYGIPEAILTDNGSPFASVLSVQGLTRLSAWWVKLLIQPRRILPGCPYMNGSHERMHKDMKAELQANPAWNLKDQQKIFNEWRESYNSIRPNEAIGMKRPSKVYEHSKVSLPTVIPEYDYPASMQVRRTSSRGYISWHQKPYFISGAIPLETIGIRQEDDESLSLWFCNLKLGETTKNFEYPLGGTRASPYSFRHARNQRRDL
jgi:transposase InsO family protein